MTRLHVLLWQRSARERLGLAAAAVVLAGATVDLGVWEPLARARAELAGRLPVMESALATLRGQSEDLARIKANAGRPTVPMDVKTLAQRAQAFGLSLSLAPGEKPTAGRLAFHLANASWTNTLALLEALRREGSWQVRELRLVRTGAGTVNADVLLEQP